MHFGTQPDRLTLPQVEHLGHFCPRSETKHSPYPTTFWFPSINIKQHHVSLQSVND